MIHSKWVIISLIICCDLISTSYWGGGATAKSTKTIKEIKEAMKSFLKYVETMNAHFTLPGDFDTKFKTIQTHPPKKHRFQIHRHFVHISSVKYRDNFIEEYMKLVEYSCQAIEVILGQIRKFQIELSEDTKNKFKDEYDKKLIPSLKIEGDSNENINSNAKTLSEKLKQLYNKVISIPESKETKKVPDVSSNSSSQQHGIHVEEKQEVHHQSNDSSAHSSSQQHKGHDDVIVFEMEPIKEDTFAEEAKKETSGSESSHSRSSEQKRGSPEEMKSVQHHSSSVAVEETKSVTIVIPAPEAEKSSLHSGYNSPESTHSLKIEHEEASGEKGDHRGDVEVKFEKSTSSSEEPTNHESQSEAHDKPIVVVHVTNNSEAASHPDEWLKESASSNEPQAIHIYSTHPIANSNADKENDEIIISSSPISKNSSSSSSKSTHEEHDKTTDPLAGNSGGSEEHKDESNKEESSAAHPVAIHIEPTHPHPISSDGNENHLPEANETSSHSMGEKHDDDLREVHYEHMEEHKSSSSEAHNGSDHEQIVIKITPPETEPEHHTSENTDNFTAKEKSKEATSESNSSHSHHEIESLHENEGSHYQEDATSAKVVVIESNAITARSESGSNDHSDGRITEHPPHTSSPEHTFIFKFDHDEEARGEEKEVVDLPEEEHNNTEKAKSKKSSSESSSSHHEKESHKNDEGNEIHINPEPAKSPEIVVHLKPEQEEAPGEEREKVDSSGDEHKQNPPVTSASKKSSESSSSGHKEEATKKDEAQVVVITIESDHDKYKEDDHEKKDNSSHHDEENKSDSSASEGSDKHNDEPSDQGEQGWVGYFKSKIWG